MNKRQMNLHVDKIRAIIKSKFEEAVDLAIAEKPLPGSAYLHAPCTVALVSALYITNCKAMMQSQFKYLPPEISKEMVRISKAKPK